MFSYALGLYILSSMCSTGSRLVGFVAFTTSEGIPDGKFRDVTLRLGCLWNYRSQGAVHQDREQVPSVMTSFPDGSRDFAQNRIPPAKRHLMPHGSSEMTKGIGTAF